MNKLLAVWQAVNGYKTYIVGTCTVVIALFNGDWNGVAVGLSALGLRHGIAKQAN